MTGFRLCEVRSNLFLSLVGTKQSGPRLPDCFVPRNDDTVLDAIEMHPSNDILMEYEEVLLRFYPRQVVVNVLNFIFYSINTLMVTPYFHWNLISVDPDDNKFVDCALNAGADFIVTHDRHFKILNLINFPPVRSIDVEAFKSLIKV